MDTIDLTGMPVVYDMAGLPLRLSDVEDFLRDVFHDIHPSVTSIAMRDDMRDRFNRLFTDVSVERHGDVVDALVVTFRTGEYDIEATDAVPANAIVAMRDGAPVACMHNVGSDVCHE